MRFLVVLDIFGQPSKIEWLAHYGAVDCLNLGDLSGRPALNAEELHRHLFEQDGMREVVRRLLDFAKDGLIGVGFSAGGTALWRAVREGLQLKKLVCVSSTRLRHEPNGLAIPTYTLWGELDPHRPGEQWCRSVPGYSIVYRGLRHNFYDETDEVNSSNYQIDLLAACCDDGEAFNIGF